MSFLSHWLLAFPSRTGILVNSLEAEMAPVRGQVRGQGEAFQLLVLDTWSSGWGNPLETGGAADGPGLFL